MIVPHPLDLIAILLGIFLALRGSDIRAEEASFHPGASAEVFAQWKRRAQFAYALGARACFTKVVLDFAFLAILRRATLDITLQRTLGVALDLVWVVAMLACWVLARRARKFGEAAGIHPGKRPAAAELATSTEDRPGTPSE